LQASCLTKATHQSFIIIHSAKDAQESNSSIQFLFSWVNAFTFLLKRYSSIFRAGNDLLARTDEQQCAKNGLHFETYDDVW
jgi:hypothetical protein